MNVRFSLLNQIFKGLSLIAIGWGTSWIHAQPAPVVAAIQPSAAATLTGQSTSDTPFPKRKAGLWEIKIAASQQAGLPPTQLCVGENTDNNQIQLDRKASTKGACKTGSFQRVGNGWLIESICKEGKFNVTSRSLASGDFESEYRIDTFVSYAPPLASGKREDKDALVAQWMGECKAGQKVGDMFVPGMGYLNMIDGSVKPIVQSQQKKTR